MTEWRDQSAVTAVCKLETAENKPSALEGRRFGPVCEKLLSILRSGWWWWRQVSGDAAYENYVRRAMRGSSERAVRGHCDAEKIVSAEQFYLDRLRREHTRINRCC
jgi:hypothetical protein